MMWSSFMRSSDGGFVEVGRLPTGSLPSQIITANLTGDGLEDLVVRNAGDGTASIYLGDRAAGSPADPRPADRPGRLGHRRGGPRGLGPG